MKKIQVFEPYILCKPVKVQTQISDIIISGQEDKTTNIREVVQIPGDNSKGIKVGDFILVRQPRYLEVPMYLTDKNEVPFKPEDKVEIMDKAQILCVFREEEK